MKKSISQSAIEELLDFTRLAPSVHNVQPWQFQLTDNVLSLHIAPERTLRYGDPTSRELWISMGICYEMVLRASSALGMTLEEESLQFRHPDKVVASFSIKSSGGIRDEAVLKNIVTRKTYRGELTQRAVAPQDLQYITEAANHLEGIEIKSSVESTVIASVAQLTYQGISLALTSPDFRNELSELVHYNWTKDATGMPGYVLELSPAGAIWERWSLNHGLDLKSKALKEKRRINEAQALIFIFTKGDVPEYWFSAGRAYNSAVLAITETGLAHSTTAAAVEAADFHEDIEKMLGTSLRLQSIIRVGYAKDESDRRTGRLSVKDILQIT